MTSQFITATHTIFSDDKLKENHTFLEKCEHFSDVDSLRDFSRNTLAEHLLTIICVLRQITKIMSRLRSI